MVFLLLRFGDHQGIRTPISSLDRGVTCHLAQVAVHERAMFHNIVNMQLCYFSVPQPKSR